MPFTVPWAMFSGTVLSTIANSVFSIFNSNSSREQQQQIHEDSIKKQFDIQQKQFEFQTEMQRESFKKQLELQIRQYELTHDWPLVGHPHQIAEYLQDNERVPLYLIIAPMRSSADRNVSTIDNNLSLFWDKVRDFVGDQFALHLDRPVMLGRYKENFNAHAETDVLAIHAALKQLPVLYIAPSIKSHENILKLTTYVWGINSKQPILNSFEIDFNKAYRETLKSEAKIYQELDFPQGTDFNIENNIEIFNKAQELLKKGGGRITEEYLDKQLRFYDKLKPTPNSFITLSEQFAAQMQMLVSVTADSYYTIGYKMPSQLKELLNHITIPDEQKKQTLKEYNNILQITQKSESNNNSVKSNKNISQIKQISTTDIVCVENQSKGSADIAEWSKHLFRLLGTLKHGKETQKDLQFINNLIDNDFHYSAFQKQKAIRCFNEHKATCILSSNEEIDLEKCIKNTFQAQLQIKMLEYVHRIIAKYKSC